MLVTITRCTEEDFNYYVDDFTHAGFRGGVNYYRNSQRNWETTRDLPKDTRVTQPVLFLAGEHDTVVMWTGGMENVRKIVESRCTRLHDVVELPDTGHW